MNGPHRSDSKDITLTPHSYGSVSSLSTADRAGRKMSRQMLISLLVHPNLNLNMDELPCVDNMINRILLNHPMLPILN
jgi:hypothetical protein